MSKAFVDTNILVYAMDRDDRERRKRCRSLLVDLRRSGMRVISRQVLQEAIDCSIVNRLWFWDALIVVSAERAMAGSLHTEDLSHGQAIPGVRINNPLKG
jgi:predicted nucleic acid-binding protein